MYYYGYVDGGHFLYTETLRYNPKLKRDVPFSGSELDSSILSSREYEQYQPQGYGIISYQRDWTYLAFWDRTGDDRGNSHSGFMVRGIWSFDQMINMAKEKFPTIFERFNFELDENNFQQLQEK
jgi:hypothetical protein